MPTQRYTIYYRGHVQGVGFRYTTHQIARSHNVTGYVRNLPDGRVELVVEADRNEANAFLEDIRDRLGNHIRNEQIDITPATNELTTLEIRH